MSKHLGRVDTKQAAAKQSTEVKLNTRNPSQQNSKTPHADLPEKKFERPMRKKPTAGRILGSFWQNAMDIVMRF
jgi:hypothetical protein